MKTLNLYFRFIVIYLKSKMEYGFYYFMDLVMNFLGAFISVVTIYVIIDKFGSINGWTTYQVILLHNVNVFSRALSAGFVWKPMIEQEEEVRTGNFDNLLSKPLHPLVHMIVRQYSHGHFFQLIFSTGVFLFCFDKVGIEWNFKNTLGLSGAIISGSFIHAANYIFTGGMSFRFLKIGSVIIRFFEDLNSFIRYPITVFNKFIQFLLTFIVPIAFVNYYPMQEIINSESTVPFFENLVYLAPVIGSIYLIASIKFWNNGLAKYQSTGS